MEQNLRKCAMWNDDKIIFCVISRLYNENIYEYLLQLKHMLLENINITLSA